MTESNPIAFLIWSYWKWARKIARCYIPKGLRR